MTGVRAWVVGVVVVVLLIGMLAFARGVANRHGIQVGVRDRYSSEQAAG